MYNTQRSISLFLSAVLLTGLLLSTVHLHELTHEDVTIPSETGQMISPDHNFCPFGGIVFKGALLATDSTPALHITGNSHLLTDGQAPVLGHTDIKRGRSPPSNG